MKETLTRGVRVGSRGQGTDRRPVIFPVQVSVLVDFDLIFIQSHRSAGVERTVKANRPRAKKLAEPQLIALEWRRLAGRAYRYDVTTWRRHFVESGRRISKVLLTSRRLP